MDLVRDIVSMILMLLGTLLLLLAAIGVVRMPDVFLRMSATSKASSLGGTLVVLAGAVHLADFGVTIRAIAVVLFLFLTAPVASHLIGRAAYRTGVPRYQGTVVDDFAAYEQRRQQGNGGAGEGDRPER